eukprot:Sspe_Gene.12862::Locus_4410_Transcript_1_1_Confidence_1.000_Length_2654::g.12862::m.12862/K15258/PARP6_8; poly [ADP-ribose] polymerase 6/8
MGKLAEDVEVARRAFPEVSNLELDDLTLTFTVSLMGEEHTVNLLMPEEYPSGEPINMEDYQPLRQGSVAEVMGTIISRLKAVERAQTGMSYATTDTDDDDMYRQPTEEMNDALVELCNDQTELDKAKVQLMKDIEHFKCVHKDNIGCYSPGGLGYSLRLAIPLRNMSAFQAQALFLHPDYRIIIDTRWNWDYIESRKVPEVHSIIVSNATALDEPFLQDNGAKCDVVKWYLENRLKKALRLNWLQRKENRAKALLFGGYDPEGVGAEKKGSGNSEPTFEDDGMKKEILAKVKMLQASGFKPKHALRALAKSDLDMQAASSYLMKTANLEADCASMEEEELLRMCVGRAVEMALQAKKEKKEASPMDFATPFENFFEGGNANILNGIMRFLKQCMQRITSNCVICDGELGFDGLKYAVCTSNPTCSFALEQFGLGCNPLSEIHNNPEVIDLLITTTTCAARMSQTSSRDSFNPWCENVELHEDYIRTHCPGYKEEKHFRTGKGKKNLELVQRLCDMLPRVREMSRAKTIADFRKGLDAKHPLLYPLLQWVISSNRSHLMPLEPRHRMEGLGDHQFVLCASNPEKEKRFRERREAMRLKRGGAGSFWAWHGSAAQNWHAILRIGLKNYSNTPMMSAGAAHGPGIYLAANFGTSQSYMGSPQAGWKNSGVHSSGGFTMIALCEVVDERNEPNTKCHEHGGIYVVEDEDLVCTRFVFLIDSKTNVSCSSAASLTKPQEILDLF